MAGEHDLYFWNGGNLRKRRLGKGSSDFTWLELPMR